MNNSPFVPQRPEDHPHLSSGDQRLLEFLDGTMPAAQRLLLEQHVAHCLQCQALCAEWRELDLQLSKNLTGPKLSAGFESRVLAAVEIQAALPSAQARSAAKARLESEAEQGWLEIRGSLIRAHIPRLLDWASYGAAAGVAIAVILQLALAFPPSQTGSNGAAATLANNPALAVATAIGAVFLLGTAVLAARPRLSRMLRWL